MSTTPIETVLAALAAHGCEPKRAGEGWQARCPSHDDQHPSLSVGIGQRDQVLVRCHAGAGCELSAIVSAIGLKITDLFMLARGAADADDEWTPRGPAVAVYRYQDETGQLLFEVCRTAGKEFPQRQPDPSKPKGWAWSLAGVRRVLYRLPRVLAAVAAGETI